MKHLVVIGASSGGLEALRVLVAALPRDFSAALAVVMHMSPQSPGVIHEILSRSGPLPAVSARTGERLHAGRIYVAPPDHHLLIEPGRARLTKGPKENRFRPAVDPLFRSAAQIYGPRAIGVVLSGNLDDGTAGLWTIKRLGGTAIVQDPADAMYPGMPQSALAHVAVDHCVPLAEIAPLLVQLTSATPGEAPQPSDVPAALEVEVKIAKEEDPLRAGIESIADPSKIACPECHGVLLQLKEAGRVRFRCHTGHAYSADSLLAEIGEAGEAAIWNAIRALQEGGLLMRQLAEHSDIAHNGRAAALRERADDWERRANVLRDVVVGTHTHVEQ
jgi:two-component system, chemotaxis family, protein-glutamate methylesterase/glutaminase